jgi:hypothetical protein
MFYVSFLKGKVGNNVVITLQLPVTDDRERVKVKPIAILDKKPMKKGNHAVVMRLI